MTNPDAPINVQEVVALRAPDTVTLEWLEGASNGGIEILDYRVSYALTTGDFVIADSSITATQYSVTTLTSG